MLNMYNDKITFVWTCSIMLNYIYIYKKEQHTSKNNAGVIDLSSLKVNVTEEQGSGQTEGHTHLSCKT